MRLATFAVLTAALVSSGLAQESQVRLSGSALIDHHVKAKWEELGLKPARRADDAEFLRRVHLDVVGVVPSGEEAAKFLADKSSDKRARLVDQLVKDPHYAAHWADIWTGILIGFDADLREQGFRFRSTNQLRSYFQKNAPYDQFAREVVGAKGVVYQNLRASEGAPEDNGLAYYLYKTFLDAGRQDFPKALAGKLTRAFMGVQIQCAQCHDHPFDKWTQEEFYGMASFFTEVRADRQVVEPKDKDKKRPANPEYYFVFEDRVPQRAAAGPLARRMMGGGDLSIPDSKTGPIKAAFLENGKGAEAGKARRETFARYLTEKENLQFARMAVNRYWAHFFGAGIVNPVDDFNGKNKPTHPELLDALARDFIDHKYDVHWLIRAIAGSEAYHLTSRAKNRDPQAEKFLALARVRALSPEQIMRSVFEATGLDQMAQRMARGREGGREQALFFLTSQFRYAFGDDEGSEVTDFNGSIPSALLMMNNELIGRGMSANPLTEFGRQLARHKTPQEKIRSIFLAALSRPPTDKEMSRWVAHVGRHPANSGYEDVLWTLLNTSEFLFNH